MWEIFLSVDSHDSTDRLTVGILHLFHQNVSHFFTHLQFLAPNNPFNEPFLFLLTVGILSQMKWREGSKLSEVFSSELQRSFILYTREMRMKTCFESSGWLAASFVTTLLMFVSNNGPGMFCPIVLVCSVEFMSKVFLKFWVEQSHLMDWNEKNGGTFPQPFSQESVWMVVDDRKQKPLKSSSSTSSVLYLALSAEGGGNVLPMEFWRTLVRSRFTISGCERECVQRLMRRKYSDFYSFSLWGGERYSLLP